MTTVPTFEAVAARSRMAASSVLGAVAGALGACIQAATAAVTRPAAADAI